MKPADLKELRSNTSGAAQNDARSYVLRLAQELGVLRSCALCKAPVVSPQEFSIAIVADFSLRGDQRDEALDEIEDIVLDSGVETGSIDSGYVCSCHEVPDGRAA